MIVWDWTVPSTEPPARAGGGAPSRCASLEEIWSEDSAVSGDAVTPLTSAWLVLASNDAAPNTKATVAESAVSAAETECDKDAGDDAGDLAATLRGARFRPFLLNAHPLAKAPSRGARGNVQKEKSLLFEEVGWRIDRSAVRTCSGGNQRQT